MRLAIPENPSRVGFGGFFTHAWGFRRGFVSRVATSLLAVDGTDSVCFCTVFAVFPAAFAGFRVRLALFGSAGRGPLVDPDDQTKLVGLLSRRTLTSAYTSLIEKLRSPAPGAAARTEAEAKAAKT